MFESDPNFGEGITIADNFGNTVKGTGQGAVGTVGNGMLYQDDAGKFATLPDLSPTELDVLKDKHGL
jgi:hypothetical protein